MDGSSIADQRQEGARPVEATRPDAKTRRGRRLGLPQLPRKRGVLPLMRVTVPQEFLPASLWL